MSKNNNRCSAVKLRNFMPCLVPFVCMLYVVALFCALGVAEPLAVYWLCGVINVVLVRHLLFCLLPSHASVFTCFSVHGLLGDVGLL